MRLSALSLALVVLALPLGLEAQPTRKVPRIGFLCARPGPSSHTQSFEQGLRELGYVVGRDIVIEYQFAPADAPDPFPRFAADLVRRNVDAIIVGTPLAIQPAREATSRVPLVMAQSGDPVASGLVWTLARPGGNITGLSSMAPELAAKQLELLKGVVPNASRIGVFWDAGSTTAAAQFRALERAAGRLRVNLQSLPVRGDPKELERAFGAMTRARADGAIVVPDMMFFEHQKRLVELAAGGRLPTVYGEREFVDAGGLLSYGTNYDDLFRRAATYVDKILKGRRPAELPVEQPTKFELVINMKTAKALGLTIPSSVLLRADQVID